jgi:hypothetical protein
LAQDQELLLRSYQHSVFANLPWILLGYRKERISLRKLLRYKLLHIHYVRNQPGDRSAGQNLQLLLVSAARFAANCAAALAGSEQRLGHQAARQPAAAELAEWNALWMVLSTWYGAPSNELFAPASLRQGKDNNQGYL